jgi:pimeloyl-ACP methyl ester carboxylesterase
LQPALKRRLYGAAGASDYLNAGDMRRIFLNTINEDLLPAATLVDRPVLMIWGANDAEVPVPVAQKLKARLPQAELVVVPEAGHFVHQDDEAAVLAELERFL